MVLQPSEERRRSGSHYTPRSLTEPIVRTTLRPILERLGAKPHARADPRPQGLRPGDGLGRVPGRGLPPARRRAGRGLARPRRACPTIPPDEDEVLYARRLVAQRCLYGVDKNPVAVDLAKLSLWLVTLAKDHAFTFVDHALRHGDSLVGLSRASRSRRSTGSPSTQLETSLETMRSREHAQRRSPSCAGEIREADESDVRRGAARRCWDEAQASWTRCGSSAISSSRRSSRRRSRRSARAKRSESRRATRG